MGAGTSPAFDVFLSHAHEDAELVERLAGRLDERGIRVWLDRWRLVPGGHWQQEMARGLDEAATCAVCIGSSKAAGWFQEEVERALNRQANDERFRVIPVLLPTCPVDPANVMPSFLDLRTWADFRSGHDSKYAFRVLFQGIKGEPVGRWPPTIGDDDADFVGLQKRLEQWHQLKPGLHESVVIEIERKLLMKWADRGWPQ